eukprot:GHVT01000584.1.p1 GENE.GHVT01000584.1~~GHVT01000584.1.p1  ORF type:complete len:125 (+),score=13.78 GHVT01000584.1:577-951(+)
MYVIACCILSLPGALQSLAHCAIRRRLCARGGGPASVRGVAVAPEWSAAGVGLATALYPCAVRHKKRASVSPRASQTVRPAWRLAGAVRGVGGAQFPVLCHCLQDHYGGHASASRQSLRRAGFW